MKETLRPQNLAKLLILLSSFQTSCHAQGDEFFSIFEEKLEPTIALDVKSMDYRRPEEGDMKAGKLVFSKFKVVTTMANVDLQNGNQIFDADIYVKPNFIGLNGPYAKFAYQIDDVNYGYLDSFQWMALEDLSFLMNRKKIELYGKDIKFQEPQTYLATRNFSLHCDRHPDYLINDGDGFNAGCFNFGTVKPQDALPAFDFRYGFKSLPEDTPQGEDPFSTDVEASIREMDVNEEIMSADAMVTKIVFSNETNLTLSNVFLSCRKHPGLIDFNAENVVVPCLSDLNLDSKSFKLDFESLEDELYLNQVIGSIDKKVIKVATPKLNYKANGINLDLINGRMNCAKEDEFDPMVGTHYIHSCFNSGSITRLNENEAVKFSFNLDDLEVEEDDDEMKYLDLSSELDYFTMGMERINLQGSNISMVLDKEIFISLNKAKIDCTKELDLIDHYVDKILGKCKQDLEASTKSVLIDDRSDENKKSFIRIFPRYINAKPKALGITASSMELLDNEDVTLMETIFLDCGRLEGNDLFNKDDVIFGCLDKGELTIDKVYTEDSKSGDELIVKNENLNFNHIKKDNKPGMEDLYMKLSKNHIYLRLKARVLGMKLKTEISGQIKYEPEKGRFILDVTSSKLPLGIRSKKILLWVVKHFVVNETIKTEGDKIIVNF